MRKRKRCSFCGMNEAEGGRMVGGPKRITICSGCTWLCFAIIHKLPTPPSDFLPKVDKRPLKERLAEFTPEEHDKIHSMIDSTMDW